jgi:hypothetical protein
MILRHFTRASLWFTGIFLSCGFVSPARAAGGEGQKTDPAAIEFFEKKIRPVLAEHCYRCHSKDAAKLKANLLLDTGAAMRKGGDSGPSLIPGQPAKSLILQALRHQGDLHMPPTGKLSDAVIADFERWIALGAPDPRDGSAVAVKEIDWEAARQYWAFQQPVKHPLPAVQNRAWPKGEIDHFLLAELEKRGLEPVKGATRVELIRRATLDLIGLPPTPDEIDAFVNDKSDDAFARVVDRLLSSPHYGERWGRVWLDVARFADDKALAMSQPYPHAYRYRDWVVQALNRDMPYDRFVRLQIAGDMMTEPEGDYFLRLAGLGFQGLGAEYHKGNFAAQVMADELDDRVDTLSRALLGLTVACARCHDHKYDPIPTVDYYSLAAAYQGATLSPIPIEPAEVVARFEKWQQDVKQREAKMGQWLQEQTRAASRQALADIETYLLTAWKVRVLRDRKLAPDDASIALQERLQSHFLRRLVKFLDSSATAKTAPPLAAWLAVASKTKPAAMEITELLATEELQKATAALRAQVESDLERSGADPKKSTTLLKALWFDANAPFALTDKDVHEVFGQDERAQYEAFKSDLEKVKKAAPPAPALVHGVQGGGKAMRVHIRGNVERLGEPAPPGFLRILKLPRPSGAKPGSFTRLDLASAIATAENPLTARVLVNRVWQQHFGRGIVATASNFGRLGERPTHPELLDTLAVRFVESGWSIKWLHREIMLSAAYQMSSSVNVDNLPRDTENRFLWRMSARRLDFEAWRDSLLAVSGRLDRTLGGPSLELSDPKTPNVRRTIYAKVSRAVPSSMLTMFDFPDANVSSDRRGTTTVPQQQLFVLNSEFMIDCATALAARVQKLAAEDDVRIEHAYRLAYGRRPSAEEKRIGLEFLHRAEPKERLSAWQQYAHALLAANEFAWVD